MKGIQYRWKFPFCRLATVQGRAVLLKVLEELPHFCVTLGIPLVKVLNWYAEFCRLTTRKITHQEEPMEAQYTRFHRVDMAPGKGLAPLSS